MGVNFVFDPDFDENILKASYRSKSSLRPLFDKVRKVTDEIYVLARESIAREAGSAEQNLQAIRSERFKPGGQSLFNFYKAKAFALRSARNSVAPTMEFDGEEIFGRVAIYRRDSSSVEFGGVDPIAEIGKGTGKYISHPPYAFLRRALDRME